MSELDSMAQEEEMELLTGVVVKYPIEDIFEIIARQDSFQVLLEMTMNEDLGLRGDVTSTYFSFPDQEVTGHFVAREEGVIAGLGLVESIAERYHPDLQIELYRKDGDPVKPGDRLAQISGWQQDVLRAERPILNFLGFLSGIATQTAEYVSQVKHTKASILDTRKTLPGWRYLSKAAVRCGGGLSHRMGLYDAMLIKDNHLHGLDDDAIVATLESALEHAASLNPRLSFVMVEVDTLEQLEIVLQKPVDIVLLDNMKPKTLSKAVKIRDERAPKVLLEASGGVNLKSVKGIAESGVDRISIGALTHSVKNFDVGLDMS